MVRVLFASLWIAGCHKNPPSTVSPPVAVILPTTLTIQPGTQVTAKGGLTLSEGADTDYEIVKVGALAAARTGNGHALASSDRNAIPDDFIQLSFPDSVMFAGAPSANVVVEVGYWDSGNDAFDIEYDAQAALFTRSHRVFKTNTQRVKTARFVLADAFFGNRDNGADLRISDLSDGAETIVSVSLTLLPPAHVIDVDSCGANPFDDQPDAAAIQSCIDRSVSGDVIRLTSGGGRSDYRGYLIDQTVFLQRGAPVRSPLLLTSTDPSDRALLQATKNLAGFVVRLFSRAGLPPSLQGQVDDITISHLHIDGDRSERFCIGPDGIIDGKDDNWGSVVPHECDVAGDSWCNAGSLALEGAFPSVGDQDFAAHPGDWGTGLVAEDLLITNTTCGTALGLNGANGVVADSSIDTAGDHVHAAGCAKFKDSETTGAWSDGMTVTGPAHQIVDNTVIDASDVGIVHFGGHETVIAGNLVHATAGNHGMFAAIAEHAWAFGEIGSTLIFGNSVVNEGDATCGGIHAGIDIGPHMWGGACATANSLGIGESGVTSAACPAEPLAPNGSACAASGVCQQWAYAPATTPLVLSGNKVSGAHLNYVIEGFDGATEALVESNNQASGARATDWQAASTGCAGVTWAPSDRVAHHPARDGWSDARIHCER